MNKYYFSIQYGLGILLDEYTGKYKIGFKSESSLLMPSEVLQVSNDIVSKMIDESYKTYFNYETINKAKSYINHTIIPNYYFMGKSITANVLGTEEYKTIVNFTSTDIKSTCTCPVHFNCKHGYALLALVKEDMNYLNKLYNLSIIDTNNKKNEYIESYIRLKNEPDRITLTNNYHEVLKTFNKDELFEFIKEINLNYSPNKYSFIHLKRLIISDPNLFYMIHENESKLRLNAFYNQIVTDYHRIYSKIDEIKRLKFESNELELKLELAYYLGYSTEYLKVLLKNNIFFRNYQASNNLFKSANYDNELINLILECSKNRFLASHAAIIIEKSNYNEELINFFSDLLNIDDFDLNQLSKPFLLNLISKNTYSDKAKEEFINNIYDYIALDYKKSFEIFYSILYNQKIPKRLDKYISLFPYNDYIYKLITYNLVDDGALDTKALSYFRVSATYPENGSIIKFSIDLGDLTLTFADLDYDLRINYFDTESAFSERLVNLIIKDYFSNEENKQEFERRKLLYQNKEKYKLTKEYEIAINSFLKSEVPLLNKMLRAHLSLELFKTNLYNNDSYSCEMKIGIDKDYIIKDISEFLSQIDKKEYETFGKSLSMVLDIKNFDDRSQKIIELFRSNYNFKVNSLNKRQKILDKVTFEALLDIYKNTYLTFDGESLYISLDEIECKCYINKDYILNIPYEVFFIGEDKIYIKNGNKINILGPLNKFNAIKFLINNNGMNISYVLPLFKEGFYYNHHDLIEIDESLTNDFKISELIINSYFDYDNKEIIKNEELYKDDNLVNKSDLDRNDLIKYNAYNNYLSNIGFIDNKIKDDSDIYKFFTMDFDELKKYANIYLSEELKNKNIIKLSIPQIRIKYQNNLVDAIFEESVFTDEELYQILSAIKKRKKYVMLKGNRIVDIATDEAKEFLEMVEDFNLDIRYLNESQQLPVYQVIKALAHEKNIEVDEYFKNMLDEIKNFKNARFELPSINGSLRGYQKEGFNFLKILSKYNLGGILADDMGLGKTLEIITLITSDIKSSPSLIVCPKSLIFNWISEIERFSPNLKAVSVTGSMSDRKDIIKSINNDSKIIYVSSYDSLRNDIELYDNINFNYIILDEAQYIKNVEAEKSKSVKKLIGTHKFALTGTPIENNIIDLWSIFEFLMPGYFEDVSSFKTKYLNDEEFTKKVSIKIAPFILRRTKSEVLKDLPPKFEQIISCEMTKPQRKIYDALRLEASDAIASGAKSFDVLPYLMRLRQACVDPKTFIDNYEDGSGKMDYLKSIIESRISGGARILIFSSFVKALNIIETMLMKMGIPYYLLTGDTNLKTRKEYVDSFNKNNDIKVFLISLKAGGTGLNLTGASVVIHMDPWWNISAMDQATDRAHRIGQTKTVEVIKLVADDSIEQRVIQLQNQKKELIDSLISNSDESITNFNKEDLKFLLD